MNYGVPGIWMGLSTALAYRFYLVWRADCLLVAKRGPVIVRV